MVYGYVRISTSKQNPERQIRNIKAIYPSAIILQEIYTGTISVRREWKKLTDKVSEGDVIVFDSVSRMSRNAEEQIKMAFEQSEKEVMDLRQRTREGIETARLNGKQIGQRKGNAWETKKSVAAKKIIQKHSGDFEGTLTDKEVMTLAGISLNTYYKYKRELRGTI